MEEMYRMRIEIIIMVLHILQWNPRNLLANGQEFKKYINDLDVVCIQTWLQPQSDFISFGKVDRQKFRKCCKESAQLITLDGSIEESNNETTQHILKAASLSIPKRLHMAGKRLCCVE